MRNRRSGRWMNLNSFGAAGPAVSLVTGKVYEAVSEPEPISRNHSRYPYQTKAGASCHLGMRPDGTLNVYTGEEADRIWQLPW